MKITILSMSLLLCAVTLSAQSNADDVLTSKKGAVILPESGDIAISVEAAPFLKYLGNAFNFNGKDVESPAFEGIDNAVSLKYFLHSDRAIRARISFQVGSTNQSFASQNDTEIATNPLNAEASVLDYKKTMSNNWGLNLGYELRRGYRRLQGFYGGEIGFSISSEKTSFEYGNEMTALNQAPTTWGVASSSRDIEQKNGVSFGIGLGGFIGVEYFFAPKMCIGGELGLNAYYLTAGVGERTYETFDSAAGTVQNISTRKGMTGINEAGLKTNTTGRLFISFLF